MMEPSRPNGGTFSYQHRTETASLLLRFRGGGRGRSLSLAPTKNKEQHIQNQESDKLLSYNAITLALCGSTTPEISGPQR